MRMVLMMSVMSAACSSSGPPPSCQQAMEHYYGAGCVYYDETTTPPTTIPQNQMQAACQQVTINAPSSCQDEIDAWLVCNNEVTSPAMSSADCDYSVAFMTLLRCR